MSGITQALFMSGASAPSFVAAASGVGSTVATITIPTVQAGDLLVVYAISRLTSSSFAITDTDTGTGAWTLVATSTTAGTTRLWTNIASSTSSGATITLSLAIDSCTAGLIVFRNATSASVLSNTPLSGGDSSIAGVTVTQKMFLMAVSNRATGTYSSQSTVSFGALTEAVDATSTSGTQTALTLAYKAISGASGTASWAFTGSAAGTAMLIQIG